MGLSKANKERQFNGFAFAYWAQIIKANILHNLTKLQGHSSVQGFLYTESIFFLQAQPVYLQILSFSDTKITWLEIVYISRGKHFLQKSYGY